MGALSAFAFGEHTGRKNAFLIGVTIMSIGAVIQTCSFSVAQMIVGRLITGTFISHTTLYWGLKQIQDLEMGWYKCLIAIRHTLIGESRINTATAPVWQSETSKPSWRGKLVVLEMM